jgi:hypothetical protein
MDMGDNSFDVSLLLFPILEVTHIVSFAIAIGTVALVDFRMLGLAMLRETPGKLTRDTRVWTLIALCTAVFSGLLMYSTDPEKFYLNVSFLFKLACLILAIVFHYTVHRRVALAQRSGSRIRVGAKLVACVSLVLWVSVVFGGIFIEFVQEGLSFN